MFWIRIVCPSAVLNLVCIRWTRAFCFCYAYTCMPACIAVCRVHLQNTTSGVQFFLRAGVLIMEDCGVGEGFQVTSWHCKEVAHTQSLRFGLFLSRAWDGMRARSTNIYHRSTSAAHGRGGPPNPGCWSCPGFCTNTRDHTTHGHNFRARNKRATLTHATKDSWC